MNKLKSFFQKIGVIRRNSFEEELDRCPSDVFMDYETLCLNQPQLNITGIWKKEKFYYIVCVGHGKDAYSLNGQDFEEWFRKHKVIASPTRISAYIPPDAKKIRILNEKEIADLAGTPRNLTFFYYDLLLSLPKSFPDFKLKDENGAITVYSNGGLSDKETAQFNEALQVMNIKLDLHFETIPLLGYSQRLLDTPLLLTPSKLLVNANSRIKEIWEEDEDFWLSNKYKLLEKNSTKKDLFSDKFIIAKSSCVVTDSNKPGNIRNYLSLYNIVYLRLPILEFQEQFFLDLRCTDKELISLCQRGRVKLIADQPIHRYENRVLNILSELESSDFILSRRLAAVNVIDIRKRLPFMFPTFDIDTKYEILHLLHKILKDHVPGDDLYKIFECLAIMWGNYFENIQRMGAYGMLNFGAYRFFDLMFRKAGKDYGVEFMDAEPGVNYAASLGSHCVPSNSFNNEPYVNVIANLYSGMPKNFVRGNQLLANTAVENILVVSNDIPVLDFAKSFNSGDIDRFHNLIYGLTKHIKDENELLSSIEQFNKEIRHYVNDSKSLGAADVRGFIIDGATAVSQTSIPFAGWFVERVTSLLNAAGRRNSAIRKVQDYLSGFVSDTKPDAVLVARMRDQLIKSYTKGKFGY